MRSAAFIFFRRPLVVVAVGGLLGASAAYATGAVGVPADVDRVGARAHSQITLVDSDGDRPLFTLPNMTPGESASSCLAVTNRSEVPVEMRLRATAGGALDPFLRIRVDRGSGLTADAPSCEGFDANAEVWSGPLSAFPATASAGVSDAALDAAKTRAYRITATMSDDNAVQGKATRMAIAFSGTGEPPADPTAVPAVEPAPAPVPVPRPAGPDEPVLIDTKPGLTCTTYYLKGTARRSAKVGRNVNAVLSINATGTGSKQRLMLATGLKTRSGKTLINKSWAKVTFKRNGKTIAVAKRRPFRVAIKPQSLKTGTNKIQMVIKNRHGKSTRATIFLKTSKALMKGRRVCVFTTTTPSTPTKKKR